MKSKIYLFSLAFTLLFSLNACKSKQSHYQQSYEAAKAQEAQQSIEEMVPIEKSKPTTESFQQERLVVVDNGDLKRYSVVIGSFINKTNAESLKNRMGTHGYNAILAQNERNMYRVIVASFDDKSRAADERNSIKTKFAPEFSDAWLLEQLY